MKQFFHRTIKNKLRKGLYKVVNADHSLSMPDPKKFIFQQFIYSFVPLLSFISLEKDPHVEYYLDGPHTPDSRFSYFVRGL